MIPGLDGEIHQRTMTALLIANFGGLAAGFGAEYFGGLGYIGIGALALYVALWYTPDAETVATEWVIRQDRPEGSA